MRSIRPSGGEVPRAPIFQRRATAQGLRETSFAADHSRTPPMRTGRSIRPPEGRRRLQPRRRPRCATPPGVVHRLRLPKAHFGASAIALEDSTFAGAAGASASTGGAHPSITKSRCRTAPLRIATVAA